MRNLERSRVLALRPERDFCVWLRFADGLVGTVCLKRLLDIGYFRALRDTRVFNTVSIDVDTGAVRWACAGIRLDPETLYQDIAARDAFSTGLSQDEPAFRRFMALALGSGGKGRAR